MSLLDNFPHECTIRKRVRARGSKIDNVDTKTNVSTGVACWEQSASAREIDEYEKRGISIDTKIYFLTDPGVTERYEIIITKRNGTAVAAANQKAFDVMSEAIPDATAGFQLVYRVMCNRKTGADQ